jgi:hypothetical protein
MRCTLLFTLALVAPALIGGTATAEPRDPLRAWLDSLPESERLDEKARDELRKKVADAEDPLEAAIRLLRPAYGAAMDVLETDGEEKAMPLLAEIVAKPPDRKTRAYAAYRGAEAMLLLERVDEAEPVLAALSRDTDLFGTPAGRSVAFLHAFARARQGHKLEAYRMFHDFLLGYPDAPERYRALARQIVRELESEYLSPLLDLSGRMKDIARLLDRVRTGEPTQEKQKEVVAILQKLIELAQQMEKSKGGGGGGGSGRAAGRSASNQSRNPMQDSMLPTGPTSIGKLRRVSRGDPGEVWGELKDKDREEALQFLKERFPGRYHELLKEYYKRLSEEK